MAWATKALTTPSPYYSKSNISKPPTNKPHFHFQTLNPNIIVPTLNPINITTRMAMKVAATASSAAGIGPRGMRALFSSVSSTFPFTLPQSQSPPPPKADPSTNLFVSGLSKRTTSEGLREAFAKFGELDHARVVTDRTSGYSKGFGFVKYKTLEGAEAGIKGMDGQFLDGWVIFAEYARAREAPAPLGNNYNTPYGRQ